MFKILVIVFCMLVCGTAFAECPSEATLHVKSSTYFGIYNIEMVKEFPHQKGAIFD